jgi:hypothetical protein
MASFILYISVYTSLHPTPIISSPYLKSGDNQMPKLKNPLLSGQAAGRLGKDLVFSSWKGISYAKLYSRPKVKKSARMQRVTGLYGQQTRRWEKLPEKCRLAWQAFCVLREYKAPAHVIFAHYSALALDVGFPEPVFPPKMRNLEAPKLSLRLDEKKNALFLSWGPGKLPEDAVMDIYFYSCKATHKAQDHFHHHLVFAPLAQKVYEMRDLKANIRYSFRVRAVMPDSSHSPFSSVSTIYERA